MIQYFYGLYSIYSYEKIMAIFLCAVQYILVAYLYVLSYVLIIVVCIS